MTFIYFITFTIYAIVLMGLVMFGMGVYIKSAGALLVAILSFMFALLLLWLKDLIIKQEFQDSEVVEDLESSSEQESSVSKRKTFQDLTTLKGNDEFYSAFNEEGIPTLHTIGVREAIARKDEMLPGVFIHVGDEVIIGASNYVFLEVAEHSRSLGDYALYLRADEFMGLVDVEELKDWAEYIVEHELITNIHHKVQANEDEFKKRELGKIIEFKNKVYDWKSK